MKILKKVISLGLALLMTAQTIPVYALDTQEEIKPSNSVEFVDRDKDHYYDSDSPATDVVFEGDNITISSTLITPQNITKDNVKWTWKPVISDWYYNTWLLTGEDSHYVVGGQDYIFYYPDDTTENFSYKDYSTYTVKGQTSYTYHNVRVWDCTLTINNADLAYNNYNFQVGWFTVIDKQVVDENGWLEYTDSDGTVFWWDPYKEKLYAEDKETYVKDNNYNLQKVLAQDTDDQGRKIYEDSTGAKYYYDEANTTLYNEAGAVVNKDISTLSVVYGKINDYEFATRHILGVEADLTTNYTVVKDLENTTVKIGDSLTLEADFVATQTPNYVRWEYSTNDGQYWQPVTFGTVENQVCTNQDKKQNDDGYYVYEKDGKEYYEKDGVIYEKTYSPSDVSIDTLEQETTPLMDSFGYYKYKDRKGYTYYYNKEKNKLYNQYYNKVDVRKLNSMELQTEPVMQNDYYLYTDGTTTYYVDSNKNVFSYGYSIASDSTSGFSPVLSLKAKDVRNKAFVKYNDACGFKTTLTIDNIGSQYSGYLFRVYVGEIEDETASGVDSTHDVWNRTSNCEVSVDWNLTLDIGEGIYSQGEYHWPSTSVKTNTEDLIKELTVEGSSKINYDRDVKNEMGLTVNEGENYIIFSSQTGKTAAEWQDFISNSLWLELEKDEAADIRFILSITPLNGAYIGKEIPENVNYYVDSDSAKNTSENETKIVITPNEPVNQSGNVWAFPDLDVRIPSDITVKSAQIQFTSSVKTEKISITGTTKFKTTKKSDTNWIITASSRATQEEWEDFFRHNVKFTLINGREISIRWVGSADILDGTEYYNQDNGHYYKIYHKPNIGWEEANAFAISTSYMGKKGYMANIADKAEDDFIKTLLPNASAGYWIGEGCDYQYINAVIKARGGTGYFSSGSWTTQRASLTEQQIFDIAAYVKGDKTYTYNGKTYTTTNYDGKDLGSSYALWFIIIGPEAGQMIYYQTTKTGQGKVFPGQVSRLNTPERDQTLHRFVHYSADAWPMCYTGHNEVPYVIVEYGGSPEDQDIENLRTYGVGKATINPGEKDLTITKVWDDLDDSYDSRPDSINVDVLQNGTKVSTVTLTSDNVSETDSNIWTVTIENMPTYDPNGALYTYTIEEQEIPNSELYEAPTYDQSTLTVTNTIVLEVKDDSVNDYWVKINKRLVNKDGENLTADDFEKLNLSSTATYRFAIDLFSFERTIELDKTTNSFVEKYGENTYDVISGIVDAGDSILIRLPAGKYEISEYAAQYFDFVSLDLVDKTSGVTFSKEGDKYYLTLSGITGQDEHAELTLTNMLDSSRPYDEKDEAENFFKV